MSWLGGYKPKPSTSQKVPVDPREAKRQKLQAEREARAKQRENRQKQLQAVVQAKLETDEACEKLLKIDPEILTGEDTEVEESEIESLLALTVDEEIVDQQPPQGADTSENISDDSNETAMTEFDAENGTDNDKAMDKLGSVKVPFTKEDIEYWFVELEGQLEVIGVKSQWLKRIALQQFLPPDIRVEIKSLLMVTKANSGDDIYKRMKTELIDLFGQKPEDAYMRAKNRVLWPS